MCFHGKSANNLFWLLMLSDIAKYIGCSFESDRHISISLFYLLIADIRRTIVCYCRCFNEDILLWKTAADCFKHILCRSYRNHFHKWNWIECNGTGDKCYVRSAEHCSFCDGISHLACRVICDVADRVNGFLRRTGSYHNLFAL